MPSDFPPPSQLSRLEQHDDQPEYPYPGVPVDKNTCSLLGPTALVVQGVMGILVIASLVFKRQREKPMRPWRIWLFDVSKQVLGQGFVHGLNLLISDIVAHVAQGNPCDLYFLNILLDTTLGVGYIYLILHASNILLTRRLNLKGFQSGEYGDPPSIKYWARQAAVYVFTILTMKLLVVGLFAVWPGIFNVGEWLLSWTGGHDSVQVIFVMGLFPIIMNVLQFWLIDSIVKASSSTQDDARQTRDAAHEPLFRDPEYEDDEDDETIRARRRIDIESPPTPHGAKSPPRSDSVSEHKYASSSSSSARAIEATAINLHAYPPESSSTSSHMVTSPLSASTSSSISSVSSFRSKKSKRRSPPPPIQRPPPHYLDRTSYTISMTPSPTPIRRTSQRSLSTYATPSSPLKPQARQRHRTAHSQGTSRAKTSTEPEAQGQWDNWAEGEDWAEKVGEEDWTGRRMDATKAGLDAWGTKGATVEVS